PKTQISSKSQSPTGSLLSVVWNLRLGISLALGVWALRIRPATDNGPLTTDNRQLTTNNDRFEIRLPPIAEEPRVYRRERAHARARHRCNDRNRQRRQHRSVRSAAGAASGPLGTIRDCA